MLLTFLSCEEGTLPITVNYVSEHALARPYREHSVYVTIRDSDSSQGNALFRMDCTNSGKILSIRHGLFTRG